MNIKANIMTIAIAVAGLAFTSPSFSSETIKVTEENYAHAETARNYRNWVKLGANKQAPT